MYTIDYTPYKLLDWVNQYQNMLYKGSTGIRTLYNSKKRVYGYKYMGFWDGLSSNPKAIHLLEKN